MAFVSCFLGNSWTRNAPLSPADASCSARVGFHGNAVLLSPNKSSARRHSNVPWLQPHPTLIEPVRQASRRNCCSAICVLAKSNLKYSFTCPRDLENKKASLLELKTPRQTQRSASSAQHAQLGQYAFLKPPRKVDQEIMCASFRACSAAPGLVPKCYFSAADQIPTMHKNLRC